MKKKARKVVKAQRAFVGMTLEDMAKKRLVSKPKNAATEAALKEVKDRAKAAKKVNAAPRPAGAAVPKQQRSVNTARGGAKR